MIGNAIPDKVNSESVEDAEETVTLAPLAVSEADCVPLVPTTTLPKLRDVGLALNCPAEVPEPESAMGGTDTVDESVTEPVDVPVTVGANEIENVADCPADSVNGVFSPLTLKPLPVTATCEILALDPPVFDT